MITSHMKKLKKDLGIESSLAKEAPGTFYFPVDDNLDITIIQLNPGVLFECEIDKMPEKNRLLFYTKLLSANLFGQGTYGAEVGISPDGRKMIIQYQIDYPLNYKEFEEKLEDFLNVAAYWRDEANAAA